MTVFSRSVPVIGALLTLLIASCNLDTPPAPVLDNPWDPNNPNAPRAPTGITAAALDETSIALGWRDMSGNEGGFRVYERAPSDITFRLLATVAADSDTIVFHDRIPATDYRYLIAAFNEAGESFASDSVLGSTSRVIPTAPANAVVTPISETDLLLTWEDHSANENGFRIYETVGDAATPTEAGTVPTDSTSFSISGRALFVSCRYFVRAFNDYGSSAATNDTSGTPGDFPPAVPSDLAAAVASEAEMSLSWTDRSVNEESFEILRCVGDSSAVADTFTCDANNTSRQFSNCDPTLDYYFRMCAVNRFKESAYTPFLKATTNETIPFAPSGLWGAAVSETGIGIAWVDNSNIETGFELQESIASDRYFVAIDTLPPNSQVASAANREPFNTYFYRVRAIGIHGNSDFSAAASVVAGSVAPAAPESLRAEAISATSVLLKWHDSTLVEERYEMFEQIGVSGQWHSVGQVGPDIGEMTVEGKTPHTTYRYHVRAVNSWGNSEFSNVVEVNMPYLPAAPTSLVATGVSPTEIRLTWRDNADNEEYYQVYWKTMDAPDFTDQGYVLADSTEFLLTNCERFTRYAIIVRAVNWVGSSDWSNQTTATPYAVLALVAANDGGLLVIDVSEPTQPELISSYDTPGLAVRVEVRSYYAFVADYWSGLRIISLASVRNPVEVGYVDTDGRAQGVALDNRYAYVADGDSGLVIVDANNPGAPNQIGQLKTPGGAYDAAVSGDYVYLAAGDAGLAVVNVHSRQAPSLARELDTPSSAFGIDINGRYACVADYASGMRVFDLNNAANPTEVGSLDTPGYAMDATISGGIALTADYDRGLRVIDIALPSNPTEIGSLDTPGQASGVAVQGNYTYVADDDGGLRIISIANPAAPQEVGSYLTATPAKGVAVMILK